MTDTYADTVHEHFAAQLDPLPTLTAAFSTAVSVEQPGGIAAMPLGVAPDVREAATEARALAEKITKDAKDSFIAANRIEADDIGNPEGLERLWNGVRSDVELARARRADLDAKIAELDQRLEARARPTSSDATAEQLARADLAALAGHPEALAQFVRTSPAARAALWSPAVAASLPNVEQLRTVALEEHAKETSSTSGRSARALLTLRSAATGNALREVDALTLHAHRRMAVPYETAAATARRRRQAEG